LNTKIMKWGKYETPGLNIMGGVQFSW
jgi:hypothetical protein